MDLEAAADLVVDLAAVATLVVEAREAVGNTDLNSFNLW